MKATLIRKKLTVFEATTQMDNLMHMALCGAPTGKIHVFTIPKNQLKRAVKFGLKLLPSPSEHVR